MVYYFIKSDGVMTIIKSKLVKVLLAVLLVIASLLVISENIYFKKRAPLGIYIGPNYVGGKTYEKIETLLEEIKTELGKKEINLYISGEDMPLNFSLEEMGITLQKERIMEEIICLNTPFDYRERIRIYRGGANIPGCFTVKDERFFSVLSPVKEERYKPPQSALIWAEEGKLKLRPHKRGTDLQLEQIHKKVMQELANWPSFPLTIQLEMEYLPPEMSISHILDRGIKSEIAAASTYFSTTSTNRSHNIILAANKLDNLLLAPEDIFSFNQIIGEASLEDGYKEAPVIVNDRLIMGPGGGICQVSSTIYNAALRAGLSIEERHNHGLPVGYLPPGYDATVAFNYKDLKFTNNAPCYILIHTQVLDNELKAIFFGDPSKIRKVKIRTKSLQIIDPPVHYRKVEDKPSSYRNLIQEGKPGYTAETIRIFYENEKEVFREHLGKNYYAPTPEIYAVGILPDNENDAGIER
ncbi:MAG: hypothetical protein C4554_08585 [Dethiobacter sp.]|jgi:vancomycin resistance protein YoaR|nr:MAG: hypothetical protein C4554_08585 [Dethiobacter sp.]